MLLNSSLLLGYYVRSLTHFSFKRLSSPLLDPFSLPPSLPPFYDSRSLAPSICLSVNEETNYVEDVLAAGSFFHYAEGFSKPEAFDLTLPETNPVGKLKGTCTA